MTPRDALAEPGAPAVREPVEATAVARPEPRLFRYRWLVAYAVAALLLLVLDAHTGEALERAEAQVNRLSAGQESASGDDATALGEAREALRDARRTFHLVPLTALLLLAGALWLAGREQARRRHAESARAEALDGTRNAASQLRALMEFGELMQSCRSIAEAMTMLRSSGPSLAGEVSGAVYLFQPGQMRLAHCGGWGRPASPPLPELPADAARERATGDGEGHGATSLSLPLLAQGETLGLLEVTAPAPLDRDARRLLRALAEQLALSLANLQLQESLRALSLRDPLTGLFNRRFLDESMERELARAARRAQPLSLIVVDVDHFKAINDSRGHDAGDAVLVALAEVLRTHSREEDIASRYGGEEFVLVMPGASAEHARRRAEEMRRAIAQLELRFRGQVLGGVTASFGVASSEDYALATASLFHAADQALYQSKRRGRDRVTVAPFDAGSGPAGEQRVEVGDRARQAVAQRDLRLP